MADRTVRVSLVANVNGYIAGMDAAKSKTQQFSDASAVQLARQREAFGQLGRASLAVGVLAVAGVALAISKFAEFDQAISNIKAVTQETTANMNLLRDAALEAGGRTIFTATEAANAIEELGKAGISTADILGGALEGALSLAASGQLEVARAAEITATTLKQYNLAGTQAGHVADVLSAAAGKALGSVEDLAQGLKFVGPVAASMGVSLEETAGALALFADQGLIGEQAGTSLRGVLSSLTSPSSQAGKELAKLNINLYDAQGGFIGLEGTAAQLANAYRGLDDKTRDASLGIIFGNQQITAARVLFAAGGEAVAKYTAEVNDAGYAARVAADRMDNLRGDLEKLGGAFDTALIQTGTGANDVLRSLTQSATFLIDGIGGLPQPVLGAGLAVAVMTAAIALSGAVAFTTVPKFLALKATINDMGGSMLTGALRAGLIGGAIGAASLVVGLFVEQAAEAKASTDSFADSLDKGTGAITDYTRELLVKRLADIGAYEAAEKVGVSQKELTDAVLAGGPALDAITEKIRGYGNAADTSTLLVVGVGNKLGGVHDELQNGIQKWKDTTAATTDSTSADGEKTATLQELGGAAAGAGEQVSVLADQIRGFSDTTLSARDAERNFQASIDDATDAFKKNGNTLDINTEAGRSNQKALDDIAKAAKEAAAAKLEQSGSEDDATAAIQAGRDALIAQLAQLGITGQAAQDYADNLGLIPENIKTVVKLNLTQAQKDLAAFIASTKGIRIGVGIYANKNLPLATGGFVSGPGTGTSDSIAANLSNGEFVATARATSVPANRAALEHMNAGGTVRGFASGGYVSATQSSGGVLTAMVDPSLLRSIRELAQAHRAVLDTVGLAGAAADGASKRAALGAS